MELAILLRLLATVLPAVLVPIHFHTRAENQSRNDFPSQIVSANLGEFAHCPTLSQDRDPHYNRNRLIRTNR